MAADALRILPIIQFLLILRVLSHLPMFISLYALQKAELLLLRCTPTAASSTHVLCRRDYRNTKK